MVYQIVSVEDEAAIIDLLRVVLRSPAIELHAAEDGPSGLALIREIRPALVILDIMLPGAMTGWDVYDTIRDDAELKDMPIIMLTVLGKKRERRREFEGSSIDLYVTKPFDTVWFRQEVERMLGQEGLWKPPQEKFRRVFNEFAETEDDEADGESGA